MATVAATASAGTPFVAFIAIEGWPILPALGTALVVGIMVSLLGLRAARRDPPDPASVEREIRDTLERRILRAGRSLRDDAPSDDDSSGGASAEPS